MENIATKMDQKKDEVRGSLKKLEKAIEEEKVEKASVVRTLRILDDRKKKSQELIKEEKKKCYNELIQKLKENLIKKVKPEPQRFSIVRDQRLEYARSRNQYNKILTDTLNTRRVF